MDAIISPQETRCPICKSFLNQDGECPFCEEVDLAPLPSDRFDGSDIRSINDQNVFECPCPICRGAPDRDPVFINLFEQSIGYDSQDHDHTDPWNGYEGEPVPTQNEWDPFPSMEKFDHNPFSAMLDGNPDEQMEGFMFLDFLDLLDD